MATNAEYQAAWRQRQRQKAATLEAELAALHNEVARLKKTNTELRNRTRNQGRVIMGFPVRCAVCHAKIVRPT
jgi:hypothetical protein